MAIKKIYQYTYASTAAAKQHRCHKCLTATHRHTKTTADKFKAKLSR